MQRFIRGCIDGTAVGLAFSLTTISAGWELGLFAAVMVAAYGWWCFFDGVTSLEKLREQEVRNG